MLKTYRGSCHCGVRPIGVGNDRFEPPAHAGHL